LPLVIWTLDQARTLARARRHMGEGGIRLNAQQKRLQRLRAVGTDTDVAEKLPHTFEDSQLLAFAHLTRLERSR